MSCVISGVGLICAVGDSARQSCAAIRAGFANLREVGYVCEPPDLVWGKPERARAAMAPVDAAGPERARALVTSALNDLVRTTGVQRFHFGTAPLRIVAPGLELAADRRVPWPNDDVEVTGGGHDAMLVQLAALAARIEDGEIDRAVVVGASVVDEPHLEALDRAGRLRSRRNDDGFIAGEAGAAILVERRDLASRPLCRIVAAAASDELSAAMRRALGDDGGASWLLCDLNGETSRSRALAMARVRLARSLGEPLAVWHPASSVGDVGPATGGVLCAVACGAWQHGYAPAARCLALATSDAGTSAAVLLQEVSA